MAIISLITKWEGLAEHERHNQDRIGFGGNRSRYDLNWSERYRGKRSLH